MEPTKDCKTAFERALEQMNAMRVRLGLAPTSEEYDKQSKELLKLEKALKKTGVITNT